jgi:hypothetical protein
MWAWFVDMSSNLTAGLLTIMVAYVAAQRFIDHRVATAIQLVIELEKDQPVADPRLPTKGEKYRFHIFNGSAEIVYKPVLLGTYPLLFGTQRSVPLADESGKVIARILPQQEIVTQWMKWTATSSDLNMLAFTTIRKHWRVQTPYVFTSPKRPPLLPVMLLYIFVSLSGLVNLMGRIINILRRIFDTLIPWALIAAIILVALWFIFQPLQYLK